MPNNTPSTDRTQDRMKAMSAEIVLAAAELAPAVRSLVGRFGTLSACLDALSAQRTPTGDADLDDKAFAALQDATGWSVALDAVRSTGLGWEVPSET